MTNLKNKKKNLKEKKAIIKIKDLENQLVNQSVNDLLCNIITITIRKKIHEEIYLQLIKKLEDTDKDKKNLEEEIKTTEKLIFIKKPSDSLIKINNLSLEKEDCASKKSISIYSYNNKNYVIKEYNYSNFIINNSISKEKYKINEYIAAKAYELLNLNNSLKDVYLVKNKNSGESSIIGIASKYEYFRSYNKLLSFNDITKINKNLNNLILIFLWLLGSDFHISNFGYKYDGEENYKKNIGSFFILDFGMFPLFNQKDTSLIKNNYINNDDYTLRKNLCLNPNVIYTNCIKSENNNEDLSILKESRIVGILKHYKRNFNSIQKFYKQEDFKITIENIEYGKKILNNPNIDNGILNILNPLKESGYINENIYNKYIDILINERKKILEIENDEYCKYINNIYPKVGNINVNLKLFKKKTLISYIKLIKYNNKFLKKYKNKINKLLLNNK